MESITATFELCNGGNYTETFSNAIEFDTYCEDNIHLFLSVKVLEETE
jgi:hypothetical protein